MILVAFTTVGQVRPLSPQELADHLAVMKKLGTAEAYAINLAVPEEYRSVMADFAAAGWTQKNRPQFFRVLEQQRQRHAAGQYQPHDAAQFRVTATTDAGADTPVEELNAINAISGIAANGTNRFKTCAISSVNGGTLSTTMAVRMYDSGTGQPIGDTAAGGGTDGLKFYDVDASGTASSAKRRVYTKYTYSWVDQQGNVWGPYVRRFDTTDVVPVITNNDPRSASIATPIVVCINRKPRDFPQCKYGSSTSNIVFPVKGNIVYPSPIDVDANNVPVNARVTWLVIDITAGGGCNAWGPGSDTKFFKKPQTTVSADRKTITWNWQPADFGAAPPCIQQGHMMNYVFNTQVYSNGEPQSASITSTPPHVTGSNAIQIAQLQAYMGCFAAGTNIKMADGSWKPIEQFEMANERVASGGSRVLTVAGNTAGRELSMIRIADAKGHVLLLTEGHPVVLRNRGITLAKDLTTADTVITDEGDAKLVSVTRVPFGGKVYNLDLGVPGERFGRDDTTMYAEHILVGDRRMQQTYGEAVARTPEQIHASLPPEWREDYLNELDAATAARIRNAQKK
jgi:hypothetical protein